MKWAITRAMAPAGVGKMDRICPNCGRPMGEFDPLCGPGGLGCLYCTKHCPNCGKEVFDQDIIYGDDGARCKYCADADSDDEDLVLAGSALGDAEILNLSGDELLKKADEIIGEVKKGLGG